MNRRHARGTKALVGFSGGSRLARPPQVLEEPDIRPDDLALYDFIYDPDSGNLPDAEGWYFNYTVDGSGNPGPEPFSLTFADGGLRARENVTNPGVGMQIRRFPDVGEDWTPYEARLRYKVQHGRGQLSWTLDTDIGRMAVVWGDSDDGEGSVLRLYDMAGDLTILVDPFTIDASVHTAKLELVDSTTYRFTHDGDEYTGYLLLPFTGSGNEVVLTAFEDTAPFTPAEADVVLVYYRLKAIQDATP